MSSIDRRQIVVAGAIAAVTAWLGGAAVAQTPPAAPSPKPLPFDPKAIPGLSEKMLVSHHDNNYAGAVKRFGEIEAQVRATDFATAPGFLINGLKREELIALNSMILHEIYFGCLGKGGGKPGAALAKQVEADFGSHDKWRAEFVGMGKALGGGSGWVLLTWSPRAGRLLNTWAMDHSLTAADGSVLVALDMYEHAYAIDYGSKAGDYVNAYMGALDWAVADRAFAGLRKI